MNRLHVLIAAHVVADIGLSWTAYVHPDQLVGVTLAAMFFGQCALLAVWGGFSKTPRARLYMGVGFGSTYLWLVVTLATGSLQRAHGRDLIAFALLTAACVIPQLALFRALQSWGPRLTVSTASRIPTIHQPFQFSIKHLLLLALGVAATLALGRAVRAVEGRQQGRWLDLFLICAVLGACALHLVLAAVWACLAADKLWLRKALAFAAALLVGFIPPFYFNVPRPEFVVFLASALGAQAVAMLSLDVVRSAGYRVVKTAAARTLQTEFAAVHPLD